MKKCPKLIVFKPDYDLYMRCSVDEWFLDYTAEANASMADIHGRMPLVLPKTQIGNWLASANASDSFLHGVPLQLSRSLVP